MLPAEQAAVLARDELDRHSVRDCLAIEVPLHTLAAKALVQLRRSDDALAHSRAAMRTLGLTQPLDFSWFEVRHVHACALAATAQPGAAEFASTLAHELRCVADQFIPEALRSGFMRGVWLNRQILSQADLSTTNPRA